MHTNALSVFHGGFVIYFHKGGINNQVQEAKRMWGFQTQSKLFSEMQLREAETSYYVGILILYPFIMIYLVLFILKVNSYSLCNHFPNKCIIIVSLYFISCFSDFKLKHRIYSEVCVLGHGSQKVFVECTSLVLGMGRVVQKFLMKNSAEAAEMTQVKNTCSCGGLGFSSQHSHDSLQRSVSPGPRDPTASSSLCEYCVYMFCIDRHPCKQTLIYIK